MQKPKLDYNIDKLHFDSWAYSMELDDFNQKTKNLLNIGREALIYLSLLIHIEEQKKHSSETVGMNFTLPQYDDF